MRRLAHPRRRRRRLGGALVERVLRRRRGRTREVGRERGDEERAAEAAFAHFAFKPA